MMKRAPPVSPLMVRSEKAGRKAVLASQNNLYRQERRRCAPPHPTLMGRSTNQTSERQTNDGVRSAIPTRPWHNEETRVKHRRSPEQESEERWRRPRHHPRQPLRCESGLKPNLIGFGSECVHGVHQPSNPTILLHFSGGGRYLLGSARERKRSLASKRGEQNAPSPPPYHTQYATAHVQNISFDSPCMPLSSLS